MIITGATASGKSARALDIAARHPSVIINADAMQLYSELRILTARPTPEEEMRAPHALYGVTPVERSCSAAGWLALAKPVIDEARLSGRLPLVTGGTGLYLKALMEGLSPMPEIAPECRAQATMLLAAEGAQALFLRDPESAGLLQPGDTQRLQRALEIWLATGKSFGWWKSRKREPLYPLEDFTVMVTELPRATLYAHCDARFLRMMQEGALEEVAALHARKLSPLLPAMRAVGVPELMAYLNGESTLEEAVRRAQQMTRNYAKRQLTWLRHQMSG